MSANLNLADLRREYTLAGLRRTALEADPLSQFSLWFSQAKTAGVIEPNAMTLSTVSAAGQPSVRIVLLKAVDERGFSFYTNYESRKARELGENPRAALNFFWGELERQVNICGTCTRLGKEESEAYFNVRPMGNRMSAWVSKQTEVIPDHAELEQRLQEVEARFGAGEIPMPPYWGGYVLEPTEIEFWQGRPNRLHDRFRYTRQADGWRIDRLSP